MKDKFREAFQNIPKVSKCFSDHSADYVTSCMILVWKCHFMEQNGIKWHCYFEAMRKAICNQVTDRRSFSKLSDFFGSLAYFSFLKTAN